MACWIWRGVRALISWRGNLLRRVWRGVVGVLDDVVVESWHRGARLGAEGAEGFSARLDEAFAAAKPFTLPVDFMARSFESIGSVCEGGFEIRRGGHFGKFALGADAGTAAVCLNDRDAFRDAPCVNGVLFVLGGDDGEGFFGAGAAGFAAGAAAEEGSGAAAAGPLLVPSEGPMVIWIIVVFVFVYVCLFLSVFIKFYQILYN